MARCGPFRGVKNRGIPAAHYKFSVHGGILSSIGRRFSRSLFDNHAAGANGPANLLGAGSWISWSGTHRAIRMGLFAPREVEVHRRGAHLLLRRLGHHIFFKARAVLCVTVRQRSRCHMPQLRLLRIGRHTHPLRRRLSPGLWKYGAPISFPIPDPPPPPPLAPSSFHPRLTFPSLLLSLL